MRISRKLLLIAITAIATTLMSAAPVSAHVEVTDEATALHCDVVPCTLSAASEAGTVITAHTLAGTEVVTSICADAFNAVIGEDGEGQLQDQRLSGVNCPNKPCEATIQESGDGHPWPLHVREEGTGTGVFHLHVVFCLQPAGGGPQRNCEITPRIVDNESHDYEFLAQDEICAGTPPPTGIRSIEVDGHWNITRGAVEINHGA